MKIREDGSIEAAVSRLLSDAGTGWSFCEVIANGGERRRAVLAQRHNPGLSPSLTERWLGNRAATRLLSLINNNLWGGTSEALGSTGKKLISGGISRGFRRTAKGLVKERL